MLTWSHNAGNLNSENFNLFQKFLGEDAPRTCLGQSVSQTLSSKIFHQSQLFQHLISLTKYLNFTRQEAGRKILKEIIQLFQLTIE